MMRCCDGEETPEKPDENTPEEPDDEETPEKPDENTPEEPDDEGTLDKPDDEKIPEIERMMEKMVAYKMELFGSASENIKDAQERMKKDYDRKRKPLSVSLLKNSLAINY